METLLFAVHINAPVARVWQVMLEPDTYREWTSEFAEGSYYEGSWDEGETIRFLTPDQQGISSVVEENRPHECISIKHMGLVRDGVGDTESPLAKEWASLHENYTFDEEGGVTVVQVDVDVTEESKDEMARGWPRALARLKAICEAD